MHCITVTLERKNLNKTSRLFQIKFFSNILKDKSNICHRKNMGCGKTKTSQNLAFCKGKIYLALIVTKKQNPLISVSLTNYKISLNRIYDCRKKEHMRFQSLYLIRQGSTTDIIQMTIHNYNLPQSGTMDMLTQGSKGKSPRTQSRLRITT